MSRVLTTIVKDFEFQTIIGMLEFERKTPQKVRFNAEFCSDEFIDYVEFRDFVKHIYQTHKFEKVEESLDRLCRELKSKFSSITHLKLEILKLEILKDAIVGARLEMIF